MNILKIQVMRGPNYWSNYRKQLIVMTIDLKQYEELPTNCLPGFKDKLLSYLPGLRKDFCSLGYEGGFVERMEEGTWLGHVIEHVALVMQCEAGMDCGFGRTYGTDNHGVYEVIFSYELEKAGLYVAYAAVNLVRALAEGKEYPSFAEDITYLKEIKRTEGLGPSTQAIIDEARKRKIPYKRHNNSSLITLGYGRNQQKIWTALTSKTSSIGVDIAADKEFTKRLLEEHFVPVPPGITIESEDELPQAIEQLGYPLAIKPCDGNHGRGVTTKIHDYEKAVFGFALAKEISDKIIVERYIAGNDYRFLVVNHKVVAVAQRTPAMVVGDGLSTIEQLIQVANMDPNRGDEHEMPLTKITIDESTLLILSQNNLTLRSVLAPGQIAYLKETANLSAGGTATDVTDRVHPQNLFFAERAAKLLNLDICGIDVVSANIQIPLNENHGAIIEVNAGPGLRMHLAPTYGQARNVAEPILNMLYPSPAEATIPIVAVTGTNGKTTVVRLIEHMAHRANYVTGATTTEGIYLNTKLIYRGDCSGPLSADTVLRDPCVDFAILECARGGILRAGLGFDECDISIITNIGNDHLGLNGINTLEELANVKSVVAFSTKKSGCAILNADDPMVYALRSELNCKIALFALSENPAIQAHCDAGGLAAYIKNGYIVIRTGHKREILAEVKEIPISFKGMATSMIQNILPAVLAGVICQFSLEMLRDSVFNFHPTPENLPGRMNLFHLPNNCDVLVDYAHNEGAFIELKNYLDTIYRKRKIGIIGMAGDRRSEDFHAIGCHIATMFDEIIIRHDADGRGRTNDEITDLLLTGIKRSNAKPAIKIISDEVHALETVLDGNCSDAFIFCAVENVFRVTGVMREKVKDAYVQSEAYDDTQG